MQQAQQLVAKEFDAVNQLIIKQLHSNVPLVENIGHYIVDAGGKRLRPMLVLLSGGATGAVTERHITFAAIIEFIHTATLLHDDVVDMSALRRGRPTANAEWGNPASVLVGDFLYTRAFQLLVELGDLELMSLMAKTTNTIAEGEVLQLTKAGDINASEEDYFHVIESKTAVLFAAATAGSGILTGCSQDDIDKFFNYGLTLGKAFQLIDDVLDYEGDAKTMGKNIGDDLSEGKPTLPLIHTMKHGSATEKALIEAAITEKSTEHIKEVITAVNNSGAIAYTKQQALNHSEQAKTLIAHLPESDHKKTLIRLADLAVSRSA